MAVGEEVLLNCAVDVFGEPARIVHAPVPTAGVLAASVVEPLTRQIVWSGPAAAVVGDGATVITTSSVELAQGLLLIVQRRV